MKIFDPIGSRLQCWKMLVVVCGLWRQSPTVEEFGVPRLLGNSKAHQQTTWVMNNGIVMRTMNFLENIIIYENNNQIIFFQNLDNEFPPSSQSKFPLT